MKRCFVIAILMVVISGRALSQATLEVTVTNISEIKGNVMVAVYNNKESFMGEGAIASAKRRVSSSEEVLVFKGLPFGECAVIIYHDVNSNGELDTNFLNIPKEPYGFSSADGSRVIIPGYEKSKFYLSSAQEQIQITLN